MGNKARKQVSLVLVAGLFFQQAGFAQAAGALSLAGYLNTAASSPVNQDKFRPVQMRYFSYEPASDNFKILLDKGDLDKLEDKKAKEEARTLLSYFLVGLTLPDEVFWVNLRPDAADNIIDPLLEKTDVGRIMLAADLQLKKDTASFTSPQTPEGREYWNKLYQKAEELYGHSPAQIPTITRPWIVPGEIIVRESQNSAYVYKAGLKVMLEEDYLRSPGHQPTNQPLTSNYSFSDPRLKELNEYSSRLIRETIIPRLTKEINSSKRYASLRQVYYSLVLSRWFKLRFTGKSGTYASLINTGNLANLTSNMPWDKSEYFNQYQQSFAKGEYNLKEQVSTPTGQSVRSYVSGGVNWASSAINHENGVMLKGGDISNTRGMLEISGSAANPLNIGLQPAVAVSSPMEGIQSYKDRIDGQVYSLESNLGNPLTEKELKSARDKFDQEGKVLPFKGLSTIAWIKENTPLYEQLRSAQEDISSKLLGAKLGTKERPIFAPVDPVSLHMTIYDLITGGPNGKENISLEKYQEIYKKVKEAFKEIGDIGEINVEVRGIGTFPPKPNLLIAKCYPKTQEDLNKFLQIRQKIENNTGIKWPLPFVAHVTLGYLVNPLSDKGYRSFLKIMDWYKDYSFGEFAFSGFDLTYFSDMNNFIPDLTKDLGKGGIIDRGFDLSHFNKMIVGNTDLSEKWMELINDTGALTTKSIYDGAQTTPDGIKTGDEIQLGLKLDAATGKIVYWGKITGGTELFRKTDSQQIRDASDRDTGFIKVLNEYRALSPKAAIVKNPGKQADPNPIHPANKKSCPYACVDSAKGNSLVTRSVSWEGKINGRIWRSQFNSNHFEENGHFLWIPDIKDPSQLRDQKVLFEDILDMLALTKESSNMIFFYNDPHAGGTVNHIHFQSIYHADHGKKMAIEKSGIASLGEVEGVKIFRLKDYLVEGLVFNNDSSPQLANIIFEFIDLIQREGIPFNFMFIKDKIYLIPRNPDGEIVSEFPNGVLASVELCGKIIIVDEDTYKKADYAKIKSAFDKIKVDERKIKDLINRVKASVLSGALVYPYSAFSVPLLSDAADRGDIEDHMLLVQAGKEYRDGEAVVKRYAALTNRMWTDLLRDKDVEGLKLHQEKLSLTVGYTNALKGNDFQTAREKLQRYVEIRDALCKRWLSLAIDAKNKKSNLPPYAYEYAKKAFDTDDYKLVKDLYEIHKDGLRDKSLYTWGVDGLIKKAKDNNIALFPLGAGGPGANIIAVSEKGAGHIKNFLEENDIKDIDNAAALTIIRGTGVLKGYLPFKIGPGGMKTEGFDGLDLPAGPKDGVFEQATGRVRELEKGEIINPNDENLVQGKLFITSIDERTGKYVNFEQGRPLDTSWIRKRISINADKVGKELSQARVNKNTFKITAPLRGVDGCGSSLDLPEFQLELTKENARRLQEFPSTPTIASDFKVEIKFEFDDNNRDAITYNAPDYGIKDYIIKQVSFEESNLSGARKLKNGQKDAPAYIFKNIFGLSGIKITCEGISPMALAGGMESSNAFNVALITAASILSGADLSYADIFNLAVKLENDEFGGLGLTGGQGHLSSMLGGAYQHIWLSGVRANPSERIKIARQDLLPEAQEFINFLGKTELENAASAISREDAGKVNPVILALGSPSPKAFKQAALDWKKYKEEYGFERVDVIASTGRGRGYKNFVLMTLEFLEQEGRENGTRYKDVFMARYPDEINKAQTVSQGDLFKEYYSSDEKDQKKFVYTKEDNNYENVFAQLKPMQDKLTEAKVIAFIMEMYAGEEILKELTLEELSNNTYDNIYESMKIIKNKEGRLNNGLPMKIQLVAASFHRLRGLLAVISICKEGKKRNNFLRTNFENKQWEITGYQDIKAEDYNWQIFANDSENAELRAMTGETFYSYLVQSIGEKNGEIERMRDIYGNGVLLEHSDEVKNELAPEGKWGKGKVERLRAKLLKYKKAVEGSTLFGRIISSWDGKMKKTEDAVAGGDEKGKVFSYTLNKIPRAIAGKLVKMFNIGRKNKRPPTALLDSLEPRFEEKPEVFCYLTQDESDAATRQMTSDKVRRIRPEEIIAKNVMFGGVETDIIVNTNPFFRGHVLMVPERLERHNQVFNKKAAAVALGALKDINRSSYKVAFNSWLAFGSINHLHLQAFDYALPSVVAGGNYLPAGKMPVENEKTEPLFEKNGVTVSTLPNWMVRTFVLSSRDSEKLQDELLALTEALYASNQPFNILFAYDSDSKEYKVYVYPRVPQKSSLFGTGVAYLELSGEVLFIDQDFNGERDEKRSREIYNNATEEDLRREVKAVGLLKEKFDAIGQLYRYQVVPSVKEVSKNRDKLTPEGLNNILGLFREYLGALKVSLGREGTNLEGYKSIAGVIEGIRNDLEDVEVGRKQVKDTKFIKKFKGELTDIVSEEDRVIEATEGGFAHMFGLRHRTANAFVFAPDGKLLLQRRVHNKAEAKKLSIFGGHLTAGQSYEEGIKKELLEELSLDEIEKELEGGLLLIGQEGQFQNNAPENNEFRSLYMYVLTKKEYAHINERKNKIDSERIGLTTLEFEGWIENQQKAKSGYGEVWGYYFTDISSIAGRDSLNIGETDPVKFSSDLLQPLANGTAPIREGTPAIDPIVEITNNLMLGPGFLDRGINKSNIENALGEFWSIFPAQRAIYPELYDRIVTREDFSLLGVDKDALFKNLAKNGYINSKGVIIKDSFRALENASEMTLDPVYHAKRGAIYGILTERLNAAAPNPAAAFGKFRDETERHKYPGPTGKFFVQFIPYSPEFNLAPLPPVGRKDKLGLKDRRFTEAYKLNVEEYPWQVFFKEKIIEGVPVIPFNAPKPYGAGHLVLLPRMFDNLPQELTVDAIKVALGLIKDSEYEQHLKIGFNGDQAWSSAPHLHLQTVFFENEENKPAEVPVETFRAKVLSENNGVTISELEDYPAKGFVFEGRDIAALTAAIHKAVSVLQETPLGVLKFTPHNLIFTKAQDDLMRVFLFPRKKQSKVAPYQIGAAFVELAGVLQISDPAIVSKITADGIDNVAREELDRINLDDNQFNALRVRIISPASAPVNSSSKGPMSNSSMQALPDKETGGIDFRSLPMSIQPMGSFRGLDFGLPSLSLQEIERINIDSQIGQIKNMVRSGISPSGRRVKELVAACAQKGQISAYADDLLACIGEILKLEEEICRESSPELKEALVIADWV